MQNSYTHTIIEGVVEATNPPVFTIQNTCLQGFSSQTGQDYMLQVYIIWDMQYEKYCGIISEKILLESISYPGYIFDHFMRFAYQG